MASVEEDTCIAVVKNKLNASLRRNHFLEEENDQLKQEILKLKAQIAYLRAQNAERKSVLRKKDQNSITSSSQDKQVVHNSSAEESLVVNNPSPTLDFSISSTRKDRAPRIPKPPPRPTLASLPSTLKVGGKEATPPPPPPLPSKLQVGPANAVRRVPEVVEMYRALTRRDAKLDARTGIQGTPITIYSREMIGEIENRSTYLIAIKSDVETQGEFIRFLTREVQNAVYRDISDLDAFVKWLDEELSYLVDERAVLKHFPQWPERKADAMREAACAYRDLKNLESEVLSFHDDPHQPTSVALKRMQALQDKLEQSVHNLERVRDSAIRRYRELQIPWEWMLDAGMIAQLKFRSMNLVKVYMKRVAIALQSDAFSEEEDLMLQGVRFAFRVHQFVGGFDAESRHAFQELRKVASSCHLPYDNQQNALCEPS